MPCFQADASVPIGSQASGVGDEISVRQRRAELFLARGTVFCSGQATWLWVKTVLGSHFGVGAPPTLVYFSGDWDVQWGGFDPWPLD